MTEFGIIIEKLDTFGNDANFQASMNAKIENIMLKTVAKYINNRLVGTRINIPKLKKLLNNTDNIVMNNGNMGYGSQGMGYGSQGMGYGSQGMGYGVPNQY